MASRQEILGSEGPSNIVPLRCRTGHKFRFERPRPLTDPGVAGHPRARAMRSIAEIREMGRRIVDDAILSDWRRRTGQSYSLRIERVADSCTNLQEPARVGNPRRVRFWVDDGTVIDEIPPATASEHVSDTRFRIEISINDDVPVVSVEDTTIALDYEGFGEGDP